jgi:hypothetical protein
LDFTHSGEILREKHKDHQDKDLLRLGKPAFGCLALALSCHEYWNDVEEGEVTSHSDDQLISKISVQSHTCF